VINKWSSPSNEMAISQLKWVQDTFSTKQAESTASFSELVHYYFKHYQQEAINSNKI
jgi:hypothetical protein